MSLTDRFHELHASGFFVMPNAFDVGSAKLLAHVGFPALATTSSGHAGSLGRLDQHVSRDELLAHAEAIAGAVGVPVNIDSEDCFADQPGGVGRTVELLGQTGAAGCSIEDWDPRAAQILPADEAAARVAEAVAAAKGSGLVVTARAEQLIHGSTDLDETIARLNAYADAGAHAVYAPGLIRNDDVERVVRSVTRPVNVLALRGGPTMAELAGCGVRRVSTGGALAWVAYGALVAAGRELLESGTTGFLAHTLSGQDRNAAFG
jgi:2-methylisocitrate lyase-like PEP mutase family enzyme